MSTPSERSDELDARLEDSEVERAIDQLSTYSHRTRRIVRWIVAVGIAALAANVAGAIALHISQSASNQADSNSHQIQVACEEGNRLRSGDRALWDRLLSMIPANETPAQRQQIVQFRVYVDNLFAPENCRHPAPPFATLPPLPTVPTTGP